MFTDRLQWRAHFSDGTTLSQYEGDRERSFRDVLNREEDLCVLELSDPNSKEVYKVNLTDGSFQVGEILIPIFNPPGTKYRVIYFKSVRLEMGGYGVVRDVDFHIGWQTTFEGRNYKLILCIKSNGDVGFMNVTQKGDIRRNIMGVK